MILLTYNQVEIAVFSIFNQDMIICMLLPHEFKVSLYIIVHIFKCSWVEYDLSRVHCISVTEELWTRVLFMLTKTRCLYIQKREKYFKTLDFFHIDLNWFKWRKCVKLFWEINPVVLETFKRWKMKTRYCHA